MRNQDSSEEMQMMMMPQPFMTIIKNDRHSRVEVHLRGEFKSPQESTQQLTELYQLAEHYPVCAVFINSDGGRVDILMEIVNILKKFDSVVTIVTSNASSAGIMLWSTGDVRVVCPHAELMAHRETSGYIDKTDAIIDRAAFLKRRFEALFVELCGGVLTPDEIDRARNGEVWLLGQDLIDRGAAISWDQFHIMDTTPIEPMPLFARGESVYVELQGLLFKADLTINEDEAYDMLDVMYDVPEKTNLLAGLAEALDEESETPRNVQSGDLFAGEADLRAFLRDTFGKGNYQLRAGEDYYTWTIRARIEGSWYNVLTGVGSFHELCTLPVGYVSDCIDELMEELTV